MNKTKEAHQLDSVPLFICNNCNNCNLKLTVPWTSHIFTAVVAIISSITIAFINVRAMFPVLILQSGQ